MKKTFKIILLVLLINNVSMFTVISSEKLSFLNILSKMDDVNFNSNVNVLAIIPDSYGANIYFNLDNMELFGWTVTLTGLTEIVKPCPWAESAFGLPEMSVDILIGDIDDISSYDVLAIMPATRRSGDAYGDLLDNVDALDLISSAKNNGLIIWATCAGVRVLAAADVLDGVKVTGSIQFKSEYDAAGALYLGEKIPPVIDQKIVTCMRDQYWNKENIEAIATALEHSNVVSKNCFDGIEKNDVLCSSPSGDMWTKSYGGISADGGRSVIIAEDEGYVVVGYTFSSAVGESDMYVVCIDEHGDILWSNTYGGLGYDYGYDICPADDSGYILTGYSTSFSTGGSKDIYVVKIDNIGNEIWSKTFGGDGLDVGMSICQADDGYLICGYTESFGYGENDIYVVKIDKTGVVLWEKQYGGSGAELGYQIRQTSDGNYVIIGASGSDRENYDFYLLKISDDGSLVWENFYGAPGGEGGYDRGHSVVETRDGGFILVGESNFGDVLNILVVKTDDQGDTEWVQVFGKPLHDHGSNVIETVDGNFVICGRFDSTDKGRNDIGLVKLNDKGDELWNKTINMHNSEWAISIIETNDGGLLLTGHTDSFGMGSYDLLIMKTDGEGNSNQKPGKPLPPTGLTSGRIMEPQIYSAVAEDPDGEDVYYLFDWGDGSESTWIGPFISGEVCETVHTWEVKGEYQISVKARDVNGGESEWSDPMEISMPKHRVNLFVEFHDAIHFLKEISRILNDRIN
jgi:hypothetical protein